MNKVCSFGLLPWNIGGKCLREVQLHFLLVDYKAGADYVRKPFYFKGLDVANQQVQCTDHTLAILSANYQNDAQWENK